MPSSIKLVKSLPFGGLLHLEPAAMVGVQIAVQVALWTLVPALLYTAPPLDVVEGYVHGPHWVLTTLKHPALPSWVLEASRLVTGAVGWPAYLVTQMFVAATLAAVFLLGRDLLGPVRAASGTLMLTGIVYFAWPTIEFNHNVALMPLWAGFFLGLWRSVETGRLFWWLATGAVAALMLYAKLSSGVAVVAGAFWLLTEARARASLASPAPWAGAFLSAALVVPLYLSLRATDFAPLAYAASRAQSVTSGPLSFIGAQFLALLGMAIPLGAALRVADPAGPCATAVASRRARTYLALVTVAPMLLVIGGGIVTGTGLRSPWGAPMLSFTGLLAAALLPNLGRSHLRRVFICSLALGLIVPIGFAGVHLWQQANDARPPRGSWPRAEMAAAARRIWQEETGRPLAYVAGHFWPTGLVALSGGTMPTVLVDGDLRSAPGVTLDDVRRKGVLIVNTANHTETPETLPGLGSPIKTGIIVVPFRHGRRGQTVTLRYAIVAPVR